MKNCSKELEKSTTETETVPNTLYSEVEGSENSLAFENLKSNKGAKENIYQEEADTAYSTVTKDKPKVLSKAKIIHGDFRADVYDTVDETSLGCAKSGTDGAMYATVDDYDHKLSGQDNETGEINVAVVKSVEITGSSEENTTDDNDAQTGQVYAAVDKSKKKDQAKLNIEGIENEETAMCENDDLYEASKDIDHTKLSVEAAETEEIVMCENDDLYEAREEIAEEIENRRDNVKCKDTNYESVLMEN